MFDSTISGDRSPQHLRDKEKWEPGPMYYLNKYKEDIKKEEEAHIIKLTELKGNLAEIAGKTYKWEEFVSINPSDRTITIGDFNFNGFEKMFKVFKITSPDKQTKIRGGIAVIFGIAKYASEHNQSNYFDGDKILEYYKEFQTTRSTRPFGIARNKKSGITGSDCESVGTVFIYCGLLTRIRLLPNKQIEIFKKT